MIQADILSVCDLFRLIFSAPTSLFELRRGLAVTLRAEADKAAAVRRSNAKAEAVLG